MLCAGSDDEVGVLAEVYPGAGHDLDAMVDQAGGWVCELHPDQPHPHGDCGVGRLRDDHERE